MICYYLLVNGRTIIIQPIFSDQPKSHTLSHFFLKKQQLRFDACAYQDVFKIRHITMKTLTGKDCTYVDVINQE